MNDTAVEWLIAQLSYLELTKNKSSFKDYYDIRLKAYDQAKAMEKEQIVDAYILPLSSEYWFKDEDFFQTEAEQYYNETYGK